MASIAFKNVGIPKEIKRNEYRVGMTPLGVKKLVNLGCKVFVAKDAGIPSGFSNDFYQQMGATLLDKNDDVYNASQLIVKVKEPLPCELKHFNENHTITSFLHFASNPDLLSRIVDLGTTTIAYETVEINNTFPLLFPMSDIAGKLAIQQTMKFMEHTNNGPGILLSGNPAPFVLIVGAGSVGLSAALLASNIGAVVVVLDKNEQLIKTYQEKFNMLQNLTFHVYTKDVLAFYLPVIDVLIGAIYENGKATEKIILSKDIAKMKSKSIIIDVSIDQGGITEVSYPTTHEEPTFVHNGVILYCVDNMPSIVPRTSTSALSKLTLPYITNLIQHGIKNSAFRQHGGVNTYSGAIMHHNLLQS